MGIGVISMKVTAFLLLSMVALFAADEVKEDQSSAFVNPIAQKIGEGELKKMDSNKDGKVDMKEVQQFLQEDYNAAWKEGYYNPEHVKLQKLSSAEVAKKSAADAQAYIGRLDKNKDPVLDLSEFTAHFDQDSDEGFDANKIWTDADEEKLNSERPEASRSQLL